MPTLRSTDLPERYQHLLGDAVTARVKRRNKYNAQACVVDGIRFDSQKEAAFYGALKIRQQVGDIKHFHRQVIFDLPGSTEYRCDFQIVHCDGRIEYVDVKSVATAKEATYRMKKRQTEALYKVEIREA